MPLQTLTEQHLKKLSLHASRIRSFTPEQREIYFQNVLNELPKESETLGNILFALVPYLFNDRIFHRDAGLSYKDSKNENRQIIRVAIASYLESLFIRNQISVH